MDGWEGLPAVSYNILANSLRGEKSFTWLLHVQYLGSTHTKKFIKNQFENGFTCCFLKMVLNSRREQTVQRTETRPWLRSRREVHVRKSPQRSDLGIWGSCCHRMPLSHESDCFRQPSIVLSPRIPAYRPSKPSLPTHSTRAAWNQIEGVGWS